MCDLPCSALAQIEMNKSQITIQLAHRIVLTFQLFSLNFSSNSAKLNPSARTMCCLSVRISQGSNFTPQAK